MRTLPAALDTARSAAVVRPFFAAELFFDEGVSRANTTPYKLTFETVESGPQLFLGVSRFGELSEISEDAELAAQRVSLRLWGIPRDMIGQAQAAHYQGRRANVYLGMLDASHQLLGTILLFMGKMDNFRIILGRQASVTVNLRSMIADWERPRDRRYTDADHQRDFPGDRFFEYVTRMTDPAYSVKWGRV